ncbi:MAG: sigma-70 family RNA polymerase sigma factor [Pseudomonadota bacterium]|nr:sigma-70 family RNA polymerase sigma factor [Pseudomonadota bacterium]
MPDDEAALMVAVSKGNQDAFQQLLHVHVDAINRFARRMSGNSHEADDITQETMLRLWQHAHKFDSRRSKLTTWLHSIARNLCMDHHRKNARFTPLEERSDDLCKGATSGGTETPGPEINLHTIQTESLVHGALLSLPERQRSALVLSYYQQLPNQAVAEILAVSLSATESLLARARRNLKQILDDSHGT